MPWWYVCCKSKKIHGKKTKGKAISHSEHWYSERLLQTARRRRCNVRDGHQKLSRQILFICQWFYFFYLFFSTKLLSLKLMVIRQCPRQSPDGRTRRFGSNFLFRWENCFPSKCLEEKKFPIETLVVCLSVNPFALSVNLIISFSSWWLLFHKLTITLNGNFVNCVYLKFYCMQNAT